MQDSVSRWRIVRKCSNILNMLKIIKIIDYVGYKFS